MKTMNLIGSPKKIDLLRYNNLDQFREITPFTSTRQGGESLGNYSNFNLSEFVRDNPVTVTKNRLSLCRELEIAPQRLYIPFQTHQDQIAVIDPNFLSSDSETQRNALHGVDALITAEQETCIGVTTADCVPILLFDPTQRVVAAIHAGWRGSVLRIAGKTVREMTKRFNTDPSDIVAAIGPSIGCEAYEVGEEVAHAFSEAGLSQAIIKNYQKPHIDLWMANRQDLTDAGLNPQNIEISGLCTFTHHKRFFSARRLGIESGRCVTGILIK